MSFKAKLGLIYLIAAIIISTLLVRESLRALEEIDHIDNRGMSLIAGITSDQNMNADFQKIGQFTKKMTPIMEKMASKDNHFAPALNMLLSESRLLSRDEVAEKAKGINYDLLKKNYLFFEQALSKEPEILLALRKYREIFRQAKINVHSPASSGRVICSAGDG